LKKKAFVLQEAEVNDADGRNEDFNRLLLELSVNYCWLKEKREEI
jgi:hypothetical protein